MGIKKATMVGCSVGGKSFCAPSDKGHGAIYFKDADGNWVVAGNPNPTRKE